MRDFKHSTLFIWIAFYALLVTFGWISSSISDRSSSKKNDSRAPSEEELIYQEGFDAGKEAVMDSPSRYDLINRTDADMEKTRAYEDGQYHGYESGYEEGYDAGFTAGENNVWCTLEDQ